MSCFVFIPGWAMPVVSYGDFVRALSEYDNVHIAEYGFFSESGSFDFETASFIDFEFPEDPFVLCAHSMGSMIALKCAAEMANIKALVLISPFARFTEAEKYCAQNPVKLDLMLRQLKKNPEKMLQAFYKSLSPNETFSIKVPDVLNSGMIADGLEFLRDSDFRNCLYKIKIPVLLLHGELDAVTERCMADFLAESLPLCEYRIVPGCGHSLPLEKGRGCADLVKDFLSANKLN